MSDPGGDEESEEEDAEGEEEESSDALGSHRDTAGSSYLTPIGQAVGSATGTAENTESELMLADSSELDTTSPQQSGAFDTRAAASENAPNDQGEVLDEMPIAVVNPDRASSVADGEDHGRVSKRATDGSDSPRRELDVTIRGGGVEEGRSSETEADPHHTGGDEENASATVREDSIAVGREDSTAAATTCGQLEASRAFGKELTFRGLESLRCSVDTPHLAWVDVDSTEDPASFDEDPPMEALVELFAAMDPSGSGAIPVLALRTMLTTWGLRLSEKEVDLCLDHLWHDRRHTPAGGQRANGVVDYRRFAEWACER